MAGNHSRRTKRRMPRPAAIEKTMELTRAGYSASAIAELIGVNARTVKEYRSAGAGLPEKPAEWRPPDPKDVSELQGPWLADSPEGFKAFTEKFSEFSPDRRPPFNGMPSHVYRTFQAAFDYDNGLWRDQVLENVPPRFAKSEYWSVWFVVWRLCLNRDSRIICLSKANMLASQFVLAVARVLETNRELIDFFGRLKPGDGEGLWRPGTGELDVAGRRDDMKERNLRARGSGEQIYGLGADWIIADDVVTSANSATQEQRDKLEFWFSSEVMNRLEPGGHIVVIGTRFHSDDLYGRLSLKEWDDEEESGEEPAKLWRHIVFPALYDPTSHLPSMAPDALSLWPEKWSIRSMRKMHKNVGTAVFSATYQQQPMPPESMLIKPEWLEACRDDERASGTAKWPRENVVRVLAFDPSGSREFGAWVLADVIPRTDRFDCAILTLGNKRAIGSADARSLWERLLQEFGYDYLIVEKNAWRASWQDVAVEQWARTNNVRFIPHNTTSNKNDAIMGIQALDRDFEFAHISIPTGDMIGRRDIYPLLYTEATSYPQGPHDDVLMALWFIKNNYKNLYPPYRGSPNPSGGFAVPEWLKGAKW